jgi:S-adenosylmethionine:tRNA ribosyltransferase-isomerase
MGPGDFEYELPPALIAQHPLAQRDHSRLLVLSGDGVAHRRFDELPGCLNSDDLLIVNDTKVLPARLIGQKQTGGRVELLLIEREAGSVWRVWLGGSRKPAIGSTIRLGAGLTAEIVSREGRNWSVRFACADGSVDHALERAGTMPVPPYIERPPQGNDADRERYQTVYASQLGAVAAPTAGLHFTPRLLADIERRGIRRTRLTLHVGPGTFQPVQVDRIEDHAMHSEKFELDEACAAAVRECRRRGGRVVAVGTTVVRVLEHCSTEGREVAPARGATELFISPGYVFGCVDAMITNFHLPRSTLLMLVSAFGGHERILAAYRAAIDAGYRFYSYGDAMWVEPS